MNVGIINTDNGSGDSCYLPNTKCTFKFNRNNLFIDKLDHYSYVHDVCGMTRDWCDDTGYEFSFEKIKGRVIPNSDNFKARTKQDNYDKFYKSGSCSFGDMDITRHKNVKYINDYPCGNKCPSCGTFWID